MTRQAIEFYAKKYFPHLTPACGFECVVEILVANGVLKRKP